MYDTYIYFYMNVLTAYNACVIVLEPMHNVYYYIYYIAYSCTLTQILYCILYITTVMLCVCIIIDTPYTIL